jgi:hypothetical protein
MYWKLEENIRLRKTCDTCDHGTSFTGKDEISLCLSDQDEAIKTEDGYFPSLTPKINTCLEWKGEIYYG